MTYAHRPNSFREQVNRWIDGASTEERVEFLAAVEAVCDRSPVVMAAFHPRPLNEEGNRVAMQMSNGLMMVWADLVDAPEFFNVIYVGRLEV